MYKLKQYNTIDERTNDINNKLLSSSSVQYVDNAKKVYYISGGVEDADGLKGIGWTDEDIYYLKSKVSEYNIWTIYDNDSKKVRQEEKDLFNNNKPLTSEFLANAGSKNIINYSPKFTVSRVDANDLFLNNKTILACPSIYSERLHYDYESASFLRKHYDMTNMFRGCISLVIAPQLIEPNNSLGSDGMFYGCTSLVYVPEYNIPSSLSIKEMFNGCSSLKTIEGLNCDLVKDTTDTFKGCVSLNNIKKFSMTSNGLSKLTFSWLSETGETLFCPLTKSSIYNIVNGLKPNRTDVNLVSTIEFTMEQLKAAGFTTQEEINDLAFLIIQNGWKPIGFDIDYNLIVDVLGLKEIGWKQADIDFLAEEVVKSTIFNSGTKFNYNVDEKEKIFYKSGYIDAKRIAEEGKNNIVNYCPVFSQEKTGGYMQMFKDHKTIIALPLLDASHMNIPMPEKGKGDLESTFENSGIVFGPKIINADAIHSANRLFYNCKNLIYVPSYTLGDLGLIGNGDEMFTNCENLKEIGDLDIKFFYTNTDKLFDGCSKLEKIGLISLKQELKLESPILPKYMFRGCHNLKEIKGISGLKYSLDLSDCTKLSYDSLCNILSTVDVAKESPRSKLYISDELLYKYKNDKKFSDLTFDAGVRKNWDLVPVKSGEYLDTDILFKMGWKRQDIDSLYKSIRDNRLWTVIEKDRKENAIPKSDTDLYPMDLTKLNNNKQSLKYCPNFGSPLGLGTLNNLFQDCAELLGVPSFDIRNYTSTSYMFASCVKLLAVPLFDMRYITDMSYMFMCCSALLEIPELNTQNVTNFECAFGGCKKIKTIPSLNTKKATTFKHMFEDCSNLESVPELDATNVVNADFMFDQCFELKNCGGFLNLKVKKMDLSSCEKLTVESILNIFNKLGTVEAGTSEILLSEVSYAKLNDDIINIAKNKGWTVLNNTKEQII